MVTWTLPLPFGYLNPHSIVQASTDPLTNSFLRLFLSFPPYKPTLQKVCVHLRLSNSYSLKHYLSYNNLDLNMNKLKLSILSNVITNYQAIMRIIIYKIILQAMGISNTFLHTYETNLDKQIAWDIWNHPSWV